jgi:SOS-response transcriptional repressor LexA
MSTILDDETKLNPDISTLANNVRYLMQEFNIDSSELSKKTGIALTTINGLKRGIGNPTLSTLHLLASFFNVSIAQLTETKLTKDKNKSSVVYEIPLLTLDNLSEFLKDNQKYKKTISTEIDMWKPNRCFAIKLTNSAMMPIFERGSIFVISRDMLAHDGDLVLVQFDHNPPCIRKVFIEGNSYFFKPISEIIGDNILKMNEFIIHGTIVKAIQYFYD